ncbi:unnamed protein product [Linum tenue]|uniref:Uncharacterized protein n=1 Tax=Linum tenue TaxID=586396 RepID=A0AAV0R298_9ROSI|nr:unnamed protein product [Linum tenue]
MKKNVLEFNDVNASVVDRFDELLGRGVSLQLISSVHGDPRKSFLWKNNFCLSYLLFGLLFSPTFGGFF